MQILYIIIYTNTYYILLLYIIYNPVGKYLYAKKVLTF